MTTAIILNWNNLNISKDSLRRLKREVPVILVDNGSTDGSRLYFMDHQEKDVDYILSSENVGISKARNFAISRVKTKYFFLIDGDILYVPGSIKILEDIMEEHPECGCVGVHNNEMVKKYSHNGTADPTEADIKATKPDGLFRNYPMAWTQYGLFRKDMNLYFPEQWPFGQAGHGYEDEWYYREMEAKGYDSYYIERPIYYHDAHSGQKELEKADVPMLMEERKKAFLDRWGESVFNGLAEEIVLLNDEANK